MEGKGRHALIAACHRMEEEKEEDEEEGKRLKPDQIVVVDVPEKDRKRKTKK